MVTQLRKSDPLILGIESSCDETAAAVIRGRALLSDEIASSSMVQAKFGGVVPEIASREHLAVVEGVVSRALKQAGVQKEQLDAVAVTYGAGLLGALLVGLSFAKGFSYGLGIPLIGVNHIRGHRSIKLRAFFRSPILGDPMWKRSRAAERITFRSPKC